MSALPYYIFNGQVIQIVQILLVQP